MMAVSQFTVIVHSLQYIHVQYAISTEERNITITVINGKDVTQYIIMYLGDSISSAIFAIIAKSSSMGLYCSKV